MSVTERKDRPGWYNVVVYDRVTVAGKKPAKVQQIVKGQRAAEKVERKLLADRDKGSLVARTQSLGDFADAYLKSRKAEVSAQTFAGYRVIIERYIKPYPIASMRVSEVTVTAVSTFYADLLAKGSHQRGIPVKPETVRGVHRVLSMMLKRATVDGVLHGNPCQVAKPPKDDQTHEDDTEPGIDPQEARRFLEAAAGTPIYTIAAVALGTGLRKSELLALRWQDIDLDAGEVDVNGKIEQVGGKVERTATKTKRSKRKVPFGPSVAAVLRQQKGRVAESKLKLTMDGLCVDEPWVFPSLRASLTRDRRILKAGRLWTPSAFAQEWRQIRDDINGRRLGQHVSAGGKVEDFAPWAFGIHALRHAYATAQLAAGVRDEVVSRRMGHSSSLVTRRVYSHVTEAEHREGVDVADGLLGGK